MADSDTAAVDPEELTALSQRLAAHDALLEPTVKDNLIRFLNSGGNPAEVISLLSENYVGTTRVISTVSSWLTEIGLTEEDVGSIAEQQLSNLISKNFDPTKADSVFTSEDIPTWVEGMVAHPVWRGMVSELTGGFRDCYFLKHAATIIDQKGYQTQEVEAVQGSLNVSVFAEIVVDRVAAALRAPQDDKDQYKKCVQDLAELVCVEQHRFVYAIGLLQASSKHHRHGHKVRRILQDLMASGIERNLDVLPLSLILSSGEGQQRAVSSLRGMISRQALNPSDMTVLYRVYSSNNPPPVELLRNQTYIDLLINALFKPGSSVNPDLLPKYSYLLAYAASVFEAGRQGNLTVNTSELKECLQALGIVRAICQRADSSLSDLLSELPVLFQHLNHKLSLISLVMVRWCAFSLSKESVFSVVTDTIALPFVILDEIACHHPVQHEEIFEIYRGLTNGTYNTLDTLVQLELKKTLMDRFLHLISLGYVLPVLQFILQCTEDRSFDRSVLRHFVFELLELVSPPYSPVFMDALLPIVNNPDVTSSLRVADGSDPVSLFIAHCHDEK